MIAPGTSAISTIGNAASATMSSAMSGFISARRADCAICSRAVSLLRPDSGSTNASSMATITNAVTVTP